MTAAELIEKLSTYQRDMTVVVRGFDETGYDHIGQIEVVEIVKIKEPGGHSGEFEETKQLGRREEPKGQPFKALLINF